MLTNDPYTLKAIEYLTGIGFLVLFIVFWRFVNGEAPAAVAVRAWSGQFADWFTLPARLLYHPGHAWARFDSPQVVTVGMDDFAQQLVGPIHAIDLPQPGARLEAGKRAWTLRADSKAVDMVAPLGGTVIAVNPALRNRAALANDEPYGRGWLMKVQVPKLGDPGKDLMSGHAARRWMEKVSDDLLRSMSPELGTLCQDGGMPVHGLARGIDDEHWDEIARKFLQP